MTRLFAWITGDADRHHRRAGRDLSLPMPRRAAGRAVPAPAAVVGDAGAPADHRGRRSAAVAVRVAVNFADIAARLNPAVVNIDATARGRRARRLIEDGAPPRPDDDPFDLGAARRRRAAARHRHRLPHRRRRPHPDQPARDRGRRAPHGEAGRRPQPARRRRRLRSRHRHRADQGRRRRRRCRTPRSAIPIDAARRRVGLRHRQSAGLRAHRHRRRGQLPRPQAVRLEPRQLHPDRRRDQLRQQRRAADQLARPGDRHQLRGQPPGQQHRLRRADQPGARACCRS